MQTVHGVDQDGNPPLIGALLRRPYLASRAHIVAALHAAGFDDIQPAHMAALQYPGPEGRSPGEIARAALASKQAMNNLLAQLERGGYLTREVSPSNRRARVVHLTDRGREVVAVIRAAVASTEAEWQRALGADDYSRFRRLLQALNAALSADE